MPLTTHTFEELLQTNAGKLERAHYTPGLEIETLKKERRESIRGLLEEREHIEQLSSVNDQRASTGIEHYGKDIVELSTITDDVTFKKLDGQQLRNHIWNSLPDGIFKRFQELFCRPDHFVVPPFQIGAKGFVTFQKDVRSIPLDLCLVSPDHIKDDFAQNTRLCEFQKGEKPLERLKQKHAAIPKLKEMFSAVETLQHGNYRFLVLREPQKCRTEGPFHAPGIAGSLVYIKGSGNGNDQHRRKTDFRTEPPQDRVIQHFRSAYKALRKPSHQTKNFDRELMDLTRLQVETESLHRRCGEWDKTMSPKEKQDIREAFSKVQLEVGRILGLCRNPHKVKAEKAFAKVGVLLERNNPSAAMATFLSIIKELGKRFTQVNPMSGFNEEDRRILMRVIATEEMQMRGYRKEFAEKTKALRGWKVPSSTKSLGIDTSAMQRITLQPLQTFASRMHEKQTALDASLGHGNRGAALQHAVELHIIGKLQGMRSFIETIKMVLAGNRIIAAEEIVDLLQKFIPYFEKRQLFPEVLIPEYEDVFTTCQDSLAHIHSCLQPYRDRTADLKPTERMYADLKDYLDTRDIESLIRELP